MYMTTWIKRQNGINKEKGHRKGYRVMNGKYCVTMDKTQLWHTSRWYWYFIMNIPFKIVIVRKTLRECSLTEDYLDQYQQYSKYNDVQLHVIDWHWRRKMKMKNKE
jgi:hypothetical protein